MLGEGGSQIHNKNKKNVLGEVRSQIQKKCFRRRRVSDPKTKYVLGGGGSQIQKQKMC